MKAVIKVGVTNAGAQRLIWIADIGKASWLKLGVRAGMIDPGGLKNSSM